MKIFPVLLCIATVSPSLFAQNGSQERAESARLGSVTYNISIRFWEDEIREFTPGERKDEIARLSERLEKGALSPLGTYELVQLLSIDGRPGEEANVVDLLTSRIAGMLEKDPDDHEALVTSVKLALRKGENERLFALLADTTLQDMTYRSLLVELSHLHFGYANYEKAEEAINYVLAADPLDSEALMIKASVRATGLIFSLLTQRFAQLIEEIEQAPPEDRLPLTAKRINEEYAEIDFSLVEKAMQRDPEHFAYHCFTGGVKEFILYLHYLGLLTALEEEDSLPRFTEETIPVLRDIEASLGEALSAKPPGDIDVYMALAIHALVTADYATARSFAQKAIDARPDLDQSYDALITVINFQRQAVEDDVATGFGESIEVIRQKERNKPLQLIDHLMLLHPLIDKGDYGAAVQQLESLEKDHPNEPSLLLFKGGVLLRMGKPAESIKVLASAQLLDTENTDILYDLGLAHMLREEYGDAKVHLEAAHEIDPSDEEVESLLEEVNREFE